MRRVGRGIEVDFKKYEQATEYNIYDHQRNILLQLDAIHQQSREATAAPQFTHAKTLKFLLIALCSFLLLLLVARVVHTWHADPSAEASKDERFSEARARHHARYLVTGAIVFGTWKLCATNRPTAQLDAVAYLEEQSARVASFAKENAERPTSKHEARSPHPAVTSFHVSYTSSLSGELHNASCLLTELAPTPADTQRVTHFILVEMQGVSHARVGVALELMRALSRADWANASAAVTFVFARKDALSCALQSPGPKVLLRLLPVLRAYVSAVASPEITSLSFHGVTLPPQLSADDAVLELAITHDSILYSGSGSSFRARAGLVQLLGENLLAWLQKAALSGPREPGYYHDYTVEEVTWLDVLGLFTFRYGHRAGEFVCMTFVFLLLILALDNRGFVKENLSWVQTSYAPVLQLVGLSAASFFLSLLSSFVLVWLLARLFQRDDLASASPLLTFTACCAATVCASLTLVWRGLLTRPIRPRLRARLEWLHFLAVVLCTACASLLACVSHFGGSYVLLAYLIAISFLLFFNFSRNKDEDVQLLDQRSLLPALLFPWLLTADAAVDALATAPTLAAYYRISEISVVVWVSVCATFLALYPLVPMLHRVGSLARACTASAVATCALFVLLALAAPFNSPEQPFHATITHRHHIDYSFSAWEESVPASFARGRDDSYLTVQGEHAWGTHTLVSRLSEGRVGSMSTWTQRDSEADAAALSWLTGSTQTPLSACTPVTDTRQPASLLGHKSVRVSTECVHPRAPTATVAWKAPGDQSAALPRVQGLHESYDSKERVRAVALSVLVPARHLVSIALPPSLVNASVRVPELSAGEAKEVQVAGDTLRLVQGERAGEFVLRVWLQGAERASVVVTAAVQVASTHLPVPLPAWVACSAYTLTNATWIA